MKRIELEMDDKTVSELKTIIKKGKRTVREVISEGNIELVIALECMDVDSYAEYLIKIQLRKGDFLP